MTSLLVARELNGIELGHSNLVILPLGSTEFHGNHAPIGTDSIIAELIAKEVAARLGGLVLPTVSYGYSALHEGDPGTISIKPDTLTMLLGDVFCSLGYQGIQRVLVVNGHDGNIPSMTIAAVEAQRKYHHMSIYATTWWEITRNEESVKTLFQHYGGKGHGGAEETSLVMAAGVGVVDLSKAEIAEFPSPSPVGDPAPFLRNDFVVFYENIQAITGKGFEGYPEEATSEKGHFILRLVADRLVECILSLEK